MPAAIETAGVLGIEDLGRHISIITEKTLETTHLFQRISVAIQRIHEQF